MSKTQLVNVQSFEPKSKQRHFHKPIKNLALAALSCAMQANVPTVVVGDPGTGKTEIIKALAKAMGKYCVALIASNRDPTDFGGFPMQSTYINKQGIMQECFRLVPPKWALELIDNPGGILFLDEYNSVSPAVAAVLHRVVLEKFVGEVALPTNTIMVAAINPPEIATNGTDFSAPTANRLFHLEWSLDPNEWCNGMANGWQIQLPPNLPSNWEQEFLPEAIGLVTGFINKSGYHLLQLPKEESKRSKAWPSPRTWHFASRLIAASRSLYGEFSEIENILVSGVIGASAAHEFFAYCRNLDLPDPEYILENPEKWEINLKRTDIVFSTISSVNSYYAFNKSIENWFRVVNLYGQLFKPENGLSDLGTMGLKFAYQNRPDGFDAKVSDDEKTKRIGWMNQYMNKFLELASYA